MPNEATPHTADAMPPATMQPWSWRSNVLFLLTAVVVVLALCIAAPFVAALTWAIALAVSAQRPYQRLLRRVQTATELLRLWQPATLRAQVDAE